MKKLSLLLIVLVISILLAACSEKENTGSKENAQASQEQPAQEGQKEQQAIDSQVDEKETVAVINGEEVQGKEYNSIFNQISTSFLQSGQEVDKEQIKKQTIDSLISQELILQDVEKKGIQVSDKDVEQSLKQLKSQYENDEQFNKALSSNGYTEEQLRTELVDELKIQQYMDSELPETKVSDKEVKTYYDEYSKQSAELPALSEVEPQIRQRLEREKQNKELMQVVDQLKEESEIEVKI